MNRLPGFRFDPKKKRARFEVIIPETDSKKRRRKTVPVLDLADATTKFHEFRRTVLDGAEEAPLTFAGYVEKYGAEIQKRGSARTATREREHLATLLPHFGKVLLRRITASDVKGFVAAIVAISDPLRAALVVLQKQAMARKDDRDLVLGGFSEVVALRYFAMAKKLAKMQ